MTEPKPRYRHYSVELKRTILAECDAPGSSVSQVSRRHDVNANQIYRWRQQLGRAAQPATVHWLPVETKADALQTVAATPSGRIEIVLSGGDRVHVVGAVHAPTLETCLRALFR